MKFCLINPNWNFEGSIYFGCRDSHLPLEYGYARQLLEQAGHEVLILDAHMENLSDDEVASRVAAFAPGIILVATAPTYLFWRCAPPELRVPFRTIAEVRRAISETLPRERRPRFVAVGPHGSATPAAVLRKLGVDAVIRGEFETALTEFTGTVPEEWSEIPGVCIMSAGAALIRNDTVAVDMGQLPALRWPDEMVSRHLHHHHRFDEPKEGKAAEIEASRGCNYQCSFCAREYFRGPYRKRPRGILLDEVDGLISQGVRYFYFIDEIFLPDRELLTSLLERHITFGVQTRMELWDYPALDLLAEAGCVSIEAGVESITESGRERLNKKSSLPLEVIVERLVYAKRGVPFVQASLLDDNNDDPDTVEAWRAGLLERGVWANKPVPVFAYPGCSEYRRRWGDPDDTAWERAHAAYLANFTEMSDIQERTPLKMTELEMELEHGE